MATYSQLRTKKQFGRMIIYYLTAQSLPLRAVTLEKRKLEKRIYPKKKKHGNGKNVKYSAEDSNANPDTEGVVCPPHKTPHR